MKPNLGPNVPISGTISNPGNPDAVAQGCTCPVMDNAHGAGAGWPTVGGGATFWITAGCPLHGPSRGEAGT
jgi:hypothetical protein